MKPTEVGRRIADRFNLTAAYGSSFDSLGVQTWRATDTVLARELRAITIPHDHPHRAEAIDAARRAGLFDDPHAASVIFIVNDENDSAIFTEFPLGTSLADYLDTSERAPLSPELVTAIIGETTSVINHARNRGIRHLQLSTQHIYISDSGDLTLDGLAYAAALNGVNTDGLSEQLDRDETRGLLVFYAALLEGQDFPCDPAQHDALIAQAAQRTDLPDRISQLFERERSYTGPRSPSELLHVIVPWGEIDLSALPTLNHPSDDATSTDSNTTTIVDNVAVTNEQDASNLSLIDSSSELAPQWPSVFEEVTAEQLLNAPDADLTLSDNLAEPKPELDQAHAQESADDTDHRDDISESTNSAVGTTDDPSSGTLPANTATSSHRIPTSTIVLGVFASLVVLALVFGLMKLFSPLAPVHVSHKDKVSAEYQEQLNQEELQATQPPSVASASFLSADPSVPESSSGKRLVRDAPRAADGDPDTVFTSWYYRVAQRDENTQFGILVELEAQASVSEVTVTSSSEGGTIQWRAYDPDNPEPGSVIAESGVTPGTTTFTSATPINTKYVLIWVTELPRDGGENKIRISEISVQ